MDGPQERSQVSEEDRTKPDAEPRLRRLERHIGRRIASGFLVLVPVLVTYLILRFVFGYVDGLLRPLAKDTPLDYTGVGVAIALVLLYVIGVFFSGKRSKALQDAVLSRVPIVRNIYTVASQATEALSSTVDHHFSRVVFLEWPRPGFMAMGFVTGHLHVPIPGKDDGATVVVYIPTVPNPTSCMLAWVPESEVIESEFTVEQAMKAVFSGGIVLPKMPVQPGLQAPDSIDEGVVR